MSEASSEPDLPLWQAYVVEYARSRHQAMAGLIFGTFSEPPVDLPFGFVVARQAQRVVLIDTGFMLEGRGATMARKFGIPDWISPLRMLAELGIEPEDVTDIVISHAHFDHMGSVGKFPRAQIYVQKTEILSWVQAMAMPPRFAFLTEVLNPDDILVAIGASIENRLTLVDGDRSNLLPGLHVRLAPGHTLGQQIVSFETKKGRFAVAGDCIYSTRNLGEAGDGTNPRYVPLGSGSGSVWDQLLSMDRLATEVDHDLSRIVILHDLSRWASFRRIAEVEQFGIYSLT